MAERTEREVLAHLIEVCQDGERGFRTAADHVKHPGLKSLFTDLAAERGRFATDLVPHLQRLGGQSPHDGTSAGTLHRSYIGFMSRLVPGQHDHQIVTEAERGEHLARDAYEDVLKGMLPPTVISLVEGQREAMQKASARIRSIDQGYA